MLCAVFFCASESYVRCAHFPWVSDKLRCNCKLTFSNIYNVHHWDDDDEYHLKMKITIANHRVERVHLSPMMRINVRFCSTTRNAPQQSFMMRNFIYFLCEHVSMCTAAVVENPHLLYGIWRWWMKCPKGTANSPILHSSGDLQWQFLSPSTRSWKP